MLRISQEFLQLWSQQCRVDSLIFSGSVSDSRWRNAGGGKKRIFQYCPLDRSNTAPDPDRSGHFVCSLVCSLMGLSQSKLVSQQYFSLKKISISQPKPAPAPASEQAKEYIVSAIEQLISALQLKYRNDIIAQRKLLFIVSLFIS